MKKQVQVGSALQLVARPGDRKLPKPSDILIYSPEQSEKQRADDVEWIAGVVESGYMLGLDADDDEAFEGFDEVVE